MPPIDVSVILCTYNPNHRFLTETIESLQLQTLPLDRWELIIIDNNSAEPVAARFDLDWHLHGRHVVETNQGLAHARRRGYAESTGRLVIHSDDDNIFQSDYLETALKLAEAHPFIGTFRGQIEPRFVVEPKNERERELGGAIRIKQSVWSNIFDDNRTMPFGAGMCLRRAVVDAYLTDVAKDPRRLVLGRSGEALLTGEDIDINYTAIKAGYGTGLFKQLSLDHYIPPEHMTEGHRRRYDAGNAYSMVILWFLHTDEVKVPLLKGSAAIWFGLRLYLRMNASARRRELGMIRARNQAVEDMKKWKWLKP